MKEEIKEILYELIHIIARINDDDFNRRKLEEIKNKINELSTPPSNKGGEIIK